MEDAAEKQRKWFPMTTRRNFMVGASATLMYAPAIVRAQSLMPLRGIISPIERDCYGFVDRLHVHLHLPKIKEFAKRRIIDSRNCREIQQVWEVGNEWQRLECGKDSFCNQAR
jgi:hypothetical protein